MLKKIDKIYLMKNFLLVIGIFVMIPASLYAQQQPILKDTTLYKAFSTSHLQPVIIGANGRYYYGGQRLRNQYSLEIPFGELDDPEVNRYFKNARVIRTVGSVLSALPGIYFLISSRVAGQTITRQAFWISYVGGVAISLTSGYISSAQLRKAVKSYNSRLGAPRWGLSVETLPNNAIALGVGWRKSF